MGLSEIMGIITIIMLVALIPEKFFKKEYSRIEDKINQVTYVLNYQLRTLVFILGLI